MKHVESFSVSATLASQRIVSVSNQIAFYPTTTATPALGVTTDTVLDTNQAIPVQINGIAKLIFNDTVAAGAVVAADSNGKGVPFTAATAGAWIIGTLVGPAVAATGTVAEILINPNIYSSE